MKYRILIAAIALAFIAGMTVRAEDKPAKPAREGQHRPGTRGEGLLPPMALEKLNLTADQKAKYDAIVADYLKDTADLRAQMKAAHESGDKEKMKPLYEQMMPIRKAAMEKVEGILTDEQKAELKKMREEHGKGGKGERHGKPGKDAPKPQE